MPNGDPVWTIAGFVKDTAEKTKKDDGKWESGKDMGVTISAFGTRFDWLAKLKGDFIILCTGKFRVDPLTGGPRIWTAKDGKVGASYEFKAEYISVVKWGDKVEEKADGTDGEVPF